MHRVVVLKLLIISFFLFLVFYTAILCRRFPYQEEGLFAETFKVDDIELRRMNLNTRHITTLNFKKNHCNVYNVSRPLTSGYECVTTRSDPQVTVCLYEEHRDMFISHDIKHTGLWEPQVLREFQEVLRQHPDLGVIDMGANIGYYTLIAAKMGHRVIAVEPLLDSIYKLHRALFIEGLQSKVTVVQNAIADERTLGSLVLSGDNQGDTKVHMSYTQCSGDCPLPINTILMDDILEVIPFESALIKMDIQGFECDALRHSEKLFNKVNVMYIIMEWGLLRNFHQNDNHMTPEKYKVHDVIRILFQRNFRPYALSADGGRPLDPNQWHLWPFDVIWRKSLQQKEYEEVVRHHFLNWP